MQMCINWIHVNILTICVFHRKIYLINICHSLFFHLIHLLILSWDECKPANNLFTLSFHLLHALFSTSNWSSMCLSFCPSFWLKIVAEQQLDLYLKFMVTMCHDSKMASGWIENQDRSVFRDYQKQNVENEWRCCQT